MGLATRCAMHRPTSRIALALSASLVGALLATLPGCWDDFSPDLHFGSDSGPAPYDCGAPGGDYVSHVPASRPTTTTTGSSHWYALDRVQLGVTNKTSGAMDPNAWKDFGFDLDGLDTTTCDSTLATHTCRRKSGAPTSVLSDGPGGIDNNFGAHFMQLMKSLKTDFESGLNDDLRAGRRGIVLRIDDVPVDVGDDATAPGALYLAGRFGDGSSAPSFTAGDRWPILDTSLKDGASLEAPIVTFPDGYVVRGVWVSGPPRLGTMLLDVGSGDVPLVLPIDDAIVSVRLADGADGTIAGAMSQENLAERLRPTLVPFDVCPGTATYDQTIEQFAESADLVLGAPHLQDVEATCNAISIGLGFTMIPTGVPTRVVAPGTLVSTCPSDAGDAGADGD